MEFRQKFRELPPWLGGFMGPTVFPKAEAKLFQSKYQNAIGLLIKCTGTVELLTSYKSVMDFLSAEIFQGGYKDECWKFYDDHERMVKDIYSYRSIEMMDKVLVAVLDLILDWWYENLTDPYTWDDFRGRIISGGIDSDLIDRPLETNAELARKRKRRSSSGWMTAKDFVLFFNNLDDDLRDARSMGVTVSRDDLGSVTPMATVPMRRYEDTESDPVHESSCVSEPKPKPKPSKPKSGFIKEQVYDIGIPLTHWDVKGIMESIELNFKQTPYKRSYIPDSVYLVKFIGYESGYGAHYRCWFRFIFEIESKLRDKTGQHAGKILHKFLWGTHRRDNVRLYGSGYNTVAAIEGEGVGDVSSDFDDLIGKRVRCKTQDSNIVRISPC